MRAVLDTNVVISALLFRAAAARLLDFWVAGRLRLVVSPAIIAEYRRALSYPRFGLTDIEVDALVAGYILPFADTVQPDESFAVCRDEHDNKFLECTVAARAEAVVTGDRALLDLGASFRGIPILTVRQAVLALPSA
jgi:uncharacterized protein